MSEKSFRQIINNAIASMHTLRYPDTEEVELRLNEILIAAKLGDISDDHLVYLDISNGKVKIRTEYSVRGCDQSDDYEFPEFIIDNENPVHAATLWGLEQRFRKANLNIEENKRLLSLAEKEYQNASNELAEYMKGIKTS